MKKNNSILIIGAIIGALIGVGAAYMYANQQSEEGEPLSLKPKDAMNLGVAVIGILRQISELGRK